MLLLDLGVYTHKIDFISEGYLVGKAIPEIDLTTTKITA